MYFPIIVFAVVIFAVLYFTMIQYIIDYFKYKEMTIDAVLSHRIIKRTRGDDGKSSHQVLYYADFRHDGKEYANYHLRSKNIKIDIPAGDDIKIYLHKNGKYYLYVSLKDIIYSNILVLAFLMPFIAVYVDMILSLLKPQ